ncbi:hypothetical protein CAOG_08095 [Capsaspora owczarzaki ATCC 30864]|uniref:hypothetical protein n=1 Tax=Capsaspora owczarzaki (strain ATCC 30864) TaxID=595528 RepID=UPI0003524384|nr:hypothetical protein CAOG_08095 [Capsaspora owczarzaki ATCC 30864]|eukprot:XP_004342696.2 hypothetical protein CAOG_08095 [Capsaspora owczarzaki ATCC 30864]
MGKKRRKVEDALLSCVCWYCERGFQDETALIAHQRNTHFQCKNCRKRLTTVPGLVRHCKIVHGYTLGHVENALPHKSRQVGLNITGMAGVPPNDSDTGNQQDAPSGVPFGASGYGYDYEHDHDALHDDEDELSHEKSNEISKRFAQFDPPAFAAVVAPERPQIYTRQPNDGLVADEERNWWAAAGAQLLPFMVNAFDAHQHQQHYQEPGPPSFPLERQHQQGESSTVGLAIAELKLAAPFSEAQSSDTLLVYSTQPTSMEERRALLPKYGRMPSHQQVAAN